MALIRLLLWGTLGVLIWRAVQRSMARSRQQPQPRRPAAGPTSSRSSGSVSDEDAIASAYRVLGVVYGDTPENIRAAYQRLVQQYHPDRMMGLAPELQALAEQRMKEINAAYGMLNRGR